MIFLRKTQGAFSGEKENIVINNGFLRWLIGSVLAIGLFLGGRITTQDKMVDEHKTMAVENKVISTSILNHHERIITLEQQKIQADERYKLMVETLFRIEKKVDDIGRNGRGR